MTDQLSFDQLQLDLFDADSQYPQDRGYRGPSACQIVGITYRQLDHWARTDLVTPSLRSASGSGSTRLYTYKDLVLLKVVRALLETGISLQRIRVAIDSLRDRGVEDLTRLSLVSDGTTVYEVTSHEEVVDLVRGNQCVFTATLSNIVKGINASIAEFPAVDLTEGDKDTSSTTLVSGTDELSVRRRARQQAS